MALTTMTVKDGTGALRSLRMSQAPDGSLVPAGFLLNEAFTEGDLSSGALTLTEAPVAIVIFNRDTVNDAVFTVNGIAIPVPAGEPYTNGVLGTASTTVTVTGSTSFYFQVLV